MAEITTEQAIRILENRLENIKKTDGLGRDIQDIIAERRTYEYCLQALEENKQLKNTLEEIKELSEYGDYGDGTAWDRLGGIQGILERFEQEE